MKVRNIVLSAGVACSLFLVGCEEAKNAASQTTSAVGDAAKAAGDSAKQATTAVTDATKDAAAKGTEAVKEVAADAAKALESAKADTTKWLTDTVEKQWPAMKTELDGAVKKVAEIKDAATKTKAEGLVKDLQGQIPSIEKMVGEIKGMDWSKIKLDEFAKLKDAAVKAWDGFGAKLKELTALLPK
jgi:hypothetical protein